MIGPIALPHVAPVDVRRAHHGLEPIEFVTAESITRRAVRVEETLTLAPIPLPIVRRLDITQVLDDGS